MRNTLREFLKLSRPLHSVSVVAKQAPLALSNAKVSCKHGLWLVALVNKKRISSDILFHRIYYLFLRFLYHTGMFPRRFIIVDAYQQDISAR